MKIKSHDFGVRVKYSPVSGLWMKYLMASQPCLSTGLKAVAPKISGFLSAMMVSTLQPFHTTHALNFTKFPFFFVESFKKGSSTVLTWQPRTAMNACHQQATEASS